MNTDVMRLPQRFDFSSHRDFFNLYQPILINKDIDQLTLDFKDVTYVDSAALGIMVLVHNKFSSAGKTVKIKNANGPTLDLLTMANMQRLFEFV